MWSESALGKQFLRTNLEFGRIPSKAMFFSMLAMVDVEEVDGGRVVSRLA